MQTGGVRPLLPEGATPLAEPYYSRLTPKPWPALDDEDRRYVKGLLQIYLVEHYALRDDLRLPELVWRWDYYSPDNPPEMNTNPAPGKSIGRHSDPTLEEVTQRVDGPSPIILQVPHWTRFPHEHVRNLVNALPTHLHEAVSLAFIQRKHVRRAATELHRSKTTVADRCDEALGVILSSVYLERWDGVRPVEAA